jgi:antitoxin component of RelBE/YafQ-DinJ toxin-antitoxin module
MSSHGFIGFRCTVALKNQLVEAAEEAGLSLTDLIVLLLRDGLKREMPEKPRRRSVL